MSRPPPNDTGGYGGHRPPPPEPYVYEYVSPTPQREIDAIAERIRQSCIDLLNEYVNDMDKQRILLNELQGLYDSVSPKTMDFIRRLQAFYEKWAKEFPLKPRKSVYF